MKIRINADFIASEMRRQKFTSRSLRLRTKEILGRNKPYSRQSLDQVLHRKNNPTFANFVAIISALNLINEPLSCLIDITTDTE